MVLIVVGHMAEVYMMAPLSCEYVQVCRRTYTNSNDSYMIATRNPCW
jgi:hypothetical protein